MSSSIYSVIIPAYNAERYLAETIQSVLAQTVPPKEIVVVDDGSSDATATVAEQQGPLIRVIRTENRGSGSATSTGIRATTTDIFATVDSDDIWLPNKMEAQLALLNDPARQLDAVLSRMAPFGETEKRTAPVETSGWARSTLVLFRKSYDKVGEIEDMGNGYGEMVDWFARAKSVGLKFLLLDEPLARRRIHSESLSFKADENQKADFLKAAIRALERKRLQSK